MEMKQANQLFNECWKIYKENARTGLTDKEWEQLVKECSAICSRFSGAMSTDMVMAVFEEIGRINDNGNKQ